MDTATDSILPAVFAGRSHPSGRRWWGIDRIVRAGDVRSCAGIRCVYLHTYAMVCACRMDNQDELQNLQEEIRKQNLLIQGMQVELTKVLAVNVSQERPNRGAHALHIRARSSSFLPIHTHACSFILVHSHPFEIIKGKCRRHANTHSVQSTSKMLLQSRMSD